MKITLALVACALAASMTAEVSAETASVDLVFAPPTSQLNTLDVTFTVTLQGQPLEDSDSASISGNALADLVMEVDPATNEVTVTSLEFTGGSFSVGSLSFLLEFGIFGNVHASGVGIAGTFDTPVPPGAVVGDTFSAAEHEMIFNSGTIEAYATGFLDGFLDPPINHDLSTEPLVASGEGTGNLLVSSPAIADDVATYDVTLSLSAAIDQRIYENELLQVDVTGGATFLAIGQFSLAVDPSIAGDLNNDNFVGQADLDIVLGQWGRNGAEITDPRADVNEDDFVGQVDLDWVLGGWGQGPGAPVPEPATLGIFALCGFVLLRRKPKSQ